MTPTTPAPPDLAQHVAWLERVLKPGMSITRTKSGWWLKRWDSWLDYRKHDIGEPRMAWLDVANAPTLSALLARLGETGHG